jgi:hypothetical protein
VVKPGVASPILVVFLSGDDDAEKTSKAGDKRGRSSGRGSVR